MSKEIHLNDIAKKYSATLFIPASLKANFDDRCIGIAPIESASSEQVTFLTNPLFEKFLSTTKAKAVIVSKEYPDLQKVQLVHANPYFLFAKIFQIFTDRMQHSKKVSEQAYVAKSAKIGTDVTVYAGATISENAVIGDRSVIFPGVFIGRNVQLGEECDIRANTVIEDGCILGARVNVHANSSIGGDGFGYAPDKNEIAKIPQVGIVRIGNDVDIGACTTIDRAAFGETKVGNFVKIDSNVHIAHNCRIGDFSMLCGSSTLAGSAKIGSRVIIAGAADLDNGVEVADNIQVGGRAGVTKDLLEPGVYLGFPAIPAMRWRRETVALRKVDELLKRVKHLEKQLETKP